MLWVSDFKWMNTIDEGVLSIKEESEVNSNGGAGASSATLWRGVGYWRR